MILGGFSTKCLHEGGCCINGGMNFVPPVLLRLKRGSCRLALPMWEELFRYTDKDEDWEFGGNVVFDWKTPPFYVRIRADVPGSMIIRQARQVSSQNNIGAYIVIITLFGVPY